MNIVLTKVKIFESCYYFYIDKNYILLWGNEMMYFLWGNEVMYFFWQNEMVYFLWENEIIWFRHTQQPS